MKQKVAVFALTLALMLFVLSSGMAVLPIHAGGGVLLSPPFDGVYRVTAYFDHRRP